MKKLYITLLILIIIIFNFKSVNAVSKNNDPMLKDLKVNGQDIGFEMFTTEYNLVFPENTEKIEIKAVADDEKGAKVQIIGDLNLTDTRNKIEIKVTAEDGKTTQSYYVYALRGNERDTNVYLKEMKIEGVELAPHFDKNVINYTFEYPNNLKQLNIEAIPEEEKATVEIIGNQDLKDELENIEIKVTSINQKNVKTYYLIAKKSNEKSEAPIGDEQEQNQDENDEEINISSNEDIHQTQSLLNAKAKNNSFIKKISIICFIIIIVLIIILVIKIKERTDEKKNH